MTSPSLSSRKRSVSALLGLASLVACSEASYQEPSSTLFEPIQSGQMDTSHSFAVGIVRGSGRAFCSGVLVGPNLVATARHCVSEIDSQVIDCSQAEFAGETFVNELRVTLDPQMTYDSAYVDVVDVILPRFSAVCGGDIAVLALAMPIALPVYVTPVLDAPVSEDVELATIGYGLDSASDQLGRSIGVRRIRSGLHVTCSGDPSFGRSCARSSDGDVLVTPEELMVSDAGGCTGDSGAGLFEGATLEGDGARAFGILSRGKEGADGSCADSVYTRLDVWGDLFVEAAERGACLGEYEPPEWSRTFGAPPRSPCEARASKATEASCNMSGNEALAARPSVLWLLSVAAIGGAVARRSVRRAR
jgi:hypothetical protein